MNGASAGSQPLAHRLLTKAIQLLVHLLQAAATIDTENDDGVTAVLAVEDIGACRRQGAVGLLERQRHGKGKQHLIATWMPRTGKDLIAKRLVEVGHTHHARTLQPLFFQKLFQILRKRRGGKVVLFDIAINAWRIEKLIEQLLSQLFIGYTASPPQIA